MEPTSSQSARTATRTSAAESAEPTQVLMQRVIALNGLPEKGAAKKPKPVLSGADLSRTVHEWGIQPHEPTAPSPQVVQSQLAHKIEVSANSIADADWATHSSISLELCDEPPLPPRILNATIDDAVTKQYTPAAAASALRRAPSFDLDTINLVRDSQDDSRFGLITHYRQTTSQERGPADPPQSAHAAPAELPSKQPQQPRMLLIPAYVVWTVLTVFSLCALAFASLIVAAILRGDFIWQP